MLFLVLALLSPALGARPGFHDTGSIEWRDCSAGGHWIHVTHLDITPKPVKLPGHMTVSLDGTISHHLANTVTTDVIMEKQLLGRYTKVPCGQDVGTCHYTDPCHFLSSFQTGTCPTQLTANGLPCTCPFNPDRLHLPASQFTVSQISPAWKFLAKGDFHVKLTMNDKQTGQLRACLELYMTIDV